MSEAPEDAAVTAASRGRQIAAGGLYLIPTVVGNLIPLITLPIFTRILTPEDYGRWALALAFSAFVTGLANFGLTIAYDRNFFEYPDARRASELLYSLLGFVFTAYAACALVTWLWRGEIAAWLIGSPEAGPLVFWVFAATGLSSLKSYYLAYLRNHGDARRYVWFTMDETILTTTFSLVLVAYVRVGIIGLPWGQFAAAAIVFLLLSLRFWRTLRPRFSAALLLDSLKLGYPLTPRIFLSVLSNNFDKYIVGLLASVGGVGVYTIGQRMSYLVFAYMTAMENVFAPEVYRRMFVGGPGSGRSIGQYLTPFVYISFAVGLVVSLFSEEALSILTPQAYHGAVPVVNRLTLYYAALFFAKQPQLVYARKTFLLSVLTLVTLTMNVALTIAGVKAFGFVGAAAGTLCAGVAGVVLYNAVARRYYRIEWEIGRIAAAGGLLVLGSAAVLLMAQTRVPYGARLGVKLLALAAYGALGWRLDILTPDNIRAGWSVVARKLRPVSGTAPSLI
jgi:O-antigen/teichoic acid export membrane protein